MDNKGKNNSNYKHGIYCTTHYCDCGKEKDYRAKKCWDCCLVDKDKVLNNLKNANSFDNLSKLTGIPRTTVTRIIKDSGIDYSHFKPGRDRLTPDDVIFSKGQKTIYATVKKRIIEKKLKDYKCVECSLSDSWNNKELKLDLDHINGDPTDNRLDNLRFLCPNCHSQTETYKGKNI